MKRAFWTVRKPKIEPDLEKLLWGYLSLKVGLMTVAFFASKILPFNYQQASLTGGVPQTGLPSWFNGFSNWDALNYMRIADYGYQDVATRWPFFPLYPYLIRVFRPLAFGNTLLTGFLISNICSFLVVIFLYRLTRLYWSKEIAFRTVVMLMVFPTSFFLSVPYTESTSLFLCLAALYYFLKGNIWAASLASFFVPLSRPQGLLFVVPLAVLGTQKIIKNYRNENAKAEGQLWQYALPTVSTILGSTAYFLFAKITFGSPLAGLNANKYYIAQKSYRDLLHPVQWFMQNFVNIHLQLYGYTTGVLDRIVLVFSFIALIWIIKTQPLVLKAFAFMFIVIPGMSGNLMSYTRTVLMAFPIFILLGTKDKMKFLIPMMAVLQVYFFIMFIQLYWVA